ncbi:hypothetical protein BG003_002851 [Podila horticola]|nr:hypothetical protein BG003_002851 [Podila horticola]
MQSDSFKRFGKDLRGVLGIRNGIFGKSKKVGNQDIQNTNQAAPTPKSTAGSQRSVEVKIDMANSPGAHDTIKEPLSFTDIGKTVKLDDQFLAPPRERGSDSGDAASPGAWSGPVTGTTNSSHSSVGSPISPGEFTKGVSPKIASSLVHLPPSINNLDRLSLQRQAWVRSFLDSTTSTQNTTNVIRSEPALDVSDVGPNKGYHGTSSRQVVSDTSEPAGLFIIKMIQVTNKASNKIFDVEWNLRVGNVEKTSLPARSFKDNPGNTVTMNEVFMFDVNEPFQLDMSLTGHPVTTKFGTMAGFSNAQAVHLGQLQLSFCLETMDRSIRTHKLRPSAYTDDKNTTKSDCEVVIMMGLHVLEEPVEDRSWETTERCQGYLTFMTRSARMSNWKRFWAVLEGRTIKLYDAEYQQKRDVLAIIPLAPLLGVHPPDLEKVDVGANGFSLAISPKGVDMSTRGEYSDVFANMDYCLYSFADSLQMRDEWTAHLQESLEAFTTHMAQRLKAQQRRLSRGAVQSNVPPSPFDGDGEGEDPFADLVELKFVW